MRKDEEMNELCAGDCSEVHMRFLALNGALLDRVIWVSTMFAEIYHAAKQAAAWYRGEDGAEVPEKLLSSMTRPGGIQDKWICHRLQSLGREMKVGVEYCFFEFNRMLQSSALTLAALSEARRFASVDEADKLMSELADYIGRAQKNHHSQEVFGKAVADKLDSIIGAFGRIHDDFVEEERVRLGDYEAPAAERKVIAKLEKVSDGVSVILKRKREPSDSYKVRLWMFTQWVYYRRHPEFCVNDVARRRVTLKDVWDTVEPVARCSYHIKDFDHFKRIYTNSRHDKRIVAAAESRQPSPEGDV